MHNGRLRTGRGGYLIPDRGCSCFGVQKDGLHERPMEGGGKAAHQYSGEDRSPRTTTSGCPIGIQWRAVDLQDRHSMEVPAGDLSAIPDLSPLLPTLVQEGHLGQGAVGTGYGPEATREDRHHRMLHRWHLLKCQKRGLDIGPTKKGKGTKIMVIADAAGLPIAIRTFGASTHEVKLVTKTLAARFIDQAPERMIGDKAYDSDDLDRKLRRKKVKMIAPHRSGRKRPATQDGRELRRYKRRWKIERLFAWIGNFRRTVTRYEFHSRNFPHAQTILRCPLVPSDQ